MGSTQRRDNSGGVSVTARVCSTLGVRCVNSTTNRHPSICQTTRVHAVSMAMIAICPSRSRCSCSSLVLRTYQHTFTRNCLRTSFLFTRQLGFLGHKACALSQHKRQRTRCHAACPRPTVVWRTTIDVRGAPIDEQLWRTDKVGIL